jgi:hypothetical protein
MIPDVTSEPAYRKAVSNLACMKENKDIFTLSFIAWLVARWDKRTAYEVVLTLIRDDNTEQ